MSDLDHTARTNRAFWNAEVEKGGGHTIPWLDLDATSLREWIANEGNNQRLLGRREPRRFVNIDPADLRYIGDVEGKDVLCLSCGGGQQSAVYSLLGARVTVVDLADRQLDGDREAAHHHGYAVTTIQSDARDLSALDAETFDVVHAMTPCYVPSIRAVYAEVARVLKPGGLYRTDHAKPATFAAAWDGEGYRITRPYAESVVHRTDGAIEHRHYLDDIFNGLIDADLTLVRVHDNARHRSPPAGSSPGDYRHESDWIGGGFTLFARKPDAR